jgi:peroxiredoxin
MDDELTLRLHKLASDLAQEDPHYIRLAEALIARLRAGGGVGAGAPEIGEHFPDFMLPTASGGLFLSQEAFEGPCVVAFLRGHWCPFCTAQAGSMMAHLAEIVAAGVRVVFVTPETGVYGSRLAGSEAVTVLCDVDNGLAASLGLLAVMDEAMVATLRADGYDLPRYQGAQSWAVPIPATFVLGPGGRVVARRIDADFRNRMPMGQLLDAVRRARSDG